MSTAPTEQSHPMPDYGAPFDIPEIQPSDVTERAGENSPKLAAMVSETGIALRLFSQQAARVDSALGRQSLPGKTSEKGNLRDRRFHTEATIIKHSSSSTDEAVKKDNDIEASDPSAEIPGEPEDTNTKTMDPKDDRSERTRPEEQLATSSATSCSSSEEEDYEYLRCDFDTIKAIPHAKFTDLVQTCCGSNGHDAFRVVESTNGTYNYVAIVAHTEPQDADPSQKYVVRVPGHGTAAH
jgi:hypothetical protein